MTDGLARSVAEQTAPAAFFDAGSEIIAHAPVVIGTTLYVPERIAEIDDPFKRELVRFYGAVRSFSYRFTRNHAAADDLAQNVMVRALEGRAGFDGKNMKSWLFTITRNTFNKSYRRERRYVHSEVFNMAPYAATKAGHVNDAPGNFVNPDKLRVSASQENALILKEIFVDILPVLPRKYVEAAVLLLAGFSHEEIAERQGSKIGTVKNAIWRVRDALASVTGHDDGVPSLLRKKLDEKPPAKAAKTQKPERPEKARKLSNKTTRPAAGG